MEIFNQISYTYSPCLNGTKIIGTLSLLLRSRMILMLTHYAKHTDSAKPTQVFMYATRSNILGCALCNNFSKDGHASHVCVFSKKNHKHNFLPLVSWSGCQHLQMPCFAYYINLGYALMLASEDAPGALPQYAKHGIFDSNFLVKSCHVKHNNQIYYASHTGGGCPQAVASFFVQNHKTQSMSLGTRENLLGRANQQVTCYQGTSETIREAIDSDFDISDYDRFKPKHIKQLDYAFLVWFIGFFEGDGSLMTRDIVVGTRFLFDSLTGRGVFELVQSISNAQLLYKIRKKLGFGCITTFERDGKEYIRYMTTKREYIILLVHLFNGNLVLKKRQQQFEQLHAQLTKAWGLNIPLKPFNCDVSLNNPWFSGFCDADAGFFINKKTEFRVGKRPSNDGYYYKFVTKFYITQDGEISLLKKIQVLFNCSENKLGKITNGKTKKIYNRLEINALESIELVLNYFSKYPLRGCRKIDCLRLARVLGYKKRHVVLSDKAAKRLVRLLDSLEEPSMAMPVNTFVNAFSPEEEKIFNELPLNQRNPNYKQSNL